MIALSAGHYPAARGAVFEDLIEHDVAVKWCTWIFDSLTAQNVPCVMIPTGPLSKKIEFINSFPGIKFAVELHFNSDPRHAGRGCEALYYPGSRTGFSMAVKLLACVQLLCQPNRGAKEGWYRMDRPNQVDYIGDVEGDEVVDAFLRQTHVPAVILEPAFIHEVDRIKTHGPEIAEALAAGLKEIHEWPAK